MIFPKVDLRALGPKEEVRSALRCALVFLDNRGEFVCNAMRDVHKALAGDTVYHNFVKQVEGELADCGGNEACKLRNFAIKVGNVPDDAAFYGKGAWMHTYRKAWVTSMLERLEEYELV